MDKEIFKPTVLPNHESAVRRMVADAKGAPYYAIRSLAEAKATADGVVVFEGDYGGQIYLVARATFVECSEDVLQELLAEIDSREWSDPDGARIYFEVHPIGRGIAGGMGGGLVTDTVWIHPRLGSLQPVIVSVLTGKTGVDSIPRP